MNLLILIFLTILGTLPLSAANEDSQEIVVSLESDIQLLPVYVGKTINEQSSFDAAYLENLEKILQFDLHHNGMTQVLPRKGNKDALISSFDQLGNASSWRSQQVYYVVQPKVKERILSLRILAVNTNTLKTFDSIALTGDFSKDRKTIHQLSDAIHKALFGTEGIASTRILYTVRTLLPGKQWSSEVWEADYDGGNARQVTQGAGYCVNPAYAPPKEGQLTGSFFYVSYLNGQPKIFFSNLKDKIGQRLTYMRGNQLMPALAPQRDRLAFISDVTGNPDLFLLTLDPDTGKLDMPRQIFSAPGAVQGTPTFSPEGERLAFVSNKDGAARVYLLNIPLPGVKLKDIKTTLISKLNRESTAPCWSPDGTKIAYCSMTNGDRQIWIYDFEKKQERQVTQGPGNKENPTWAPNSLHLIFNSTGAQGSDLYLINLNQKQATKISIGAGEKHYPCWEPR